MTTRFKKDPDAILDYAWDWSDWLESTETIVDHTIISPSGITIDSDSESGGIVTAWVSGGTARAKYTVTCRIETSLGRTDDRSVIIEGEQK